MGSKKKADSTPEEWALYLKRQRENNKKSYHKNIKTVRGTRNRKQRERWATDAEYRKKRLEVRKAYQVKPEALEVKRKRDCARSRLKLAGMCQDTFDTLLALQKGRCAVCGCAFIKTPHADHCHDTGSARGLLCASCNSIEGQIKAKGFTPAEFATRLQQYLDSPPILIIMEIIG